MSSHQQDIINTSIEDARLVAQLLGKSLQDHSTQEHAPSPPQQVAGIAEHLQQNKERIALTDNKGIFKFAILVTSILETIPVEKVTESIYVPLLVRFQKLQGHYKFSDAEVKAVLPAWEQISQRFPNTKLEDYNLSL